MKKLFLLITIVLTTFEINSREQSVIDIITEVSSQTRSTDTLTIWQQFPDLPLSVVRLVARLNQILYTGEQNNNNEQT